MLLFQFFQSYRNLLITNPIIYKQNRIFSISSTHRKLYPSDLALKTFVTSNVIDECVTQKDIHYDVILLFDDIRVLVTGSRLKEKTDNFLSPHLWYCQANDFLQHCNSNKFHAFVCHSVYE